MKKNFTFLLLLFFSINLYCQIRITDRPEDGFEQRIRLEVDSIWIIDTHEHLMPEKARIKMGDEIDFSYLFTHYAKEDLISASNEPGLIDVIYQHKFSEEDRWEVLAPFYASMRSTGYGRVPLIVARDLFGVSDINAVTYSILSKKIKEASHPGWYEYVLKKRARIELSVLDMGHARYDNKFYRHVERFDDFIQISSLSEVKALGDRYDMSVTSLSDYLAVLRKAFEEGVNYGMVGVKSALAYKRILYYENVPGEKARTIFNSLLNKEALNRDKIKALQDYMMHRVLDLTDEFNLPIQYHTGLQAGNGNTLTNSKPTHLANLFMEYPDVNFVLFHGGYPFGGELSALAKNFPNVFIDMCWTYVISPSYSERYLHEWIETVPANKIMAFGGDYSLVEAVYAHSVMARETIINVLTEKVRTQYLTEKEALHIAKLILRENALQLFHLKDKKNTVDKIEALNKPGELHDWWKMYKSGTGFIKNWKVIGPFDFGKGLDQKYPPENNIQLNKTYTGQGGIKTEWITGNTGESGYLNFIKVFRSRYQNVTPELEGIAYAYSEVLSPDNRKITMSIGSNDGAKMWINGEVVYKLHAGRAAFPDQDIIKVNLRKGWNKILVKVENLGANWGLYVRILNPENELKLKEFQD